MTNTFFNLHRSASIKRVVLAILATFVSYSALAADTLSLWYHGAGNPEEMSVLRTVVSDFNASQSDWTVEIEAFPENAYNSTVVAAALSGSLPDIVDVDGPIMPNWAWAGYLAPLDIPESQLEDFLPGTIGRY
ncbi:MAG: ABC transporter substrate-binding protein, partial [Natronospirillum sp.]